MHKTRVYSRYGLEAAKLLGMQIKLGRKKRKWSESELAQRAGIARDTVRKIEKGDMTAAFGLVLELAALVGVELFNSDTKLLSQKIEITGDKIALLAATPKARRVVDDDF